MAALANRERTQRGPAVVELGEALVAEAEEVGFERPPAPSGVVREYGVRIPAGVAPPRVATQRGQQTTPRTSRVPTTLMVHSEFGDGDTS